MEYGHAHLINPSLGMYQEIPPCRPISVDNMFQAYCCSLVLFNKYACAVFAFYAKYEFVCVLFPWFGLFWSYFCLLYSYLFILLLVSLRCCDIVPLYPSLSITLDIGLNKWCASEMVWWWCEPTDDEISSQPFSFCSVGNNSGRLDSRNLLSNWWGAHSDSNHFFAFM